MKTIAVGPFELVASCVTGGTTVAMFLMELCCCHWEVAVLVNDGVVFSGLATALAS